MCVQDLLEQMGKQDKMMRKLKKHLKNYTKKFGETEGKHLSFKISWMTIVTRLKLFCFPLEQFLICIYISTAGVYIDQASPESQVGDSGRTVSIVRKERDFRGILEYRKEDENKLLKTLITGDLNITNTHTFSTVQKS